MNKPWQKYVLPEDQESEIWELFHENSKLDTHTKSLSEQEVLARMADLSEALPYLGYPIIELSAASLPITLPLGQAITARASRRELAEQTVSIEALSSLLHLAYGQNRDNKETGYPRPFRVAPSAGALYPLELYVLNLRVKNLAPGLYHFNPAHHHLRLLSSGNHVDNVAAALVQPELAHCASLIIFITSLFERSTFKYGARGYRFALLEAGHVAQNVNLVTTALNLGSVNIGGYFDRAVDKFLGLDGIRHSTVYAIAL
jgi:SagB-type dehydrogenase family enzyme